MKANITRVISNMALIAGLAVSLTALASNSADVTKILAGSTALELPAKAANLVAKASAADKQNVAIAVVKAAIRINPSAAVAIVSAVARENPATAAVAAVTAAILQHKRLDLITKAAAAAAPSEAAKIVAALIREFPQSYGIIAIAAAEGAPAAGREILAVVADYVPALQSGIQSAITSFAANGNVPVQAILSQSYNNALTSGTQVMFQVPSTLLSQNDNQVLALNPGAATSTKSPITLSQTTPTTTVRPTLSPPTLGPPYQPIPGPVTNIGPGQITVQQPGGTNYSAPP
jgi:hypothetical protein